MLWVAAVGFDAVKIATATVGSVFLILDSGTQWDTYNMGVGINGLVKEKPSGAGEIMRNQADDLYMRCHVYDSHTFYNFPIICPNLNSTTASRLKIVGW